MKILIAGDGKVGSTLANQLSREGYDLTLIDTDGQALENTMERLDVITVQGNGATMETLRQAGVEDASLLIAVTGADEVNLLCCMTAHSMNPKLHTIARIRDPEYAEQAYMMRSSFALSLIVNPEKQAAHEIERLLRYPGTLKCDTFARGRVEIVELRIGPESVLRDVPLSRLESITGVKVLVCAVLRGGRAIAPDGNFVLLEDDSVFITATTDTLAGLLRNIGVSSRRVSSVLIAGGGKVSYYLAERLHRSGIAAEIIEKDADRCMELADLLPDTTIVKGDASKPDFLDNEGLDEADALVTLTGLDELNILISLYGYKKKVPQIVTKVGRNDYSEVLNDLPVGSVISPKELCGNSIVRYVRAMHNQQGAAVTIHKIANGQAEAIEFIADENTRHLGEPLRAIPLRKNVLVTSITSGMRTELPSGNSFFRAGDSVVVVCDGDTVLYSLNDIFAD